jgi:arabinofuranan 3-O-arabinosyltransferase
VYASLSVLAQLVRRPAPWTARIAAYVVFLLFNLVAMSLTPISGKDDTLIVDAARNLLHGQSPYLSDRFLYLPSSLPFALVQTVLPDHRLVWVLPFAGGALLLVAWWAALRLFDVGLGSWLGVLGVVAFGFLGPPSSVVYLGNWASACAAGAAVTLLLMGRGRWLAAGVALGVSIAIKPMLVPLGLLFLLHRRWAGFAAAAGIPVVMSAAVLAVIPRPGLFFTKTLPFLFGGQDEYARPYDSSLQAILPRLGVGPHWVAAARVAVALATVATAVLRWRAGGEPRLRLVETSAILMIGTFAVATPTFGYYPIVVVPTLVASVVVTGSVARSGWLWLGMAPQSQVTPMPWIDFPQFDQVSVRQAFKPVLWMAVTGVLLVVSIWRHRREDSPPDRVRGAVPAQAAPAPEPQPAPDPQPA